MPAHCFATVCIHLVEKKINKQLYCIFSVSNLLIQNKFIQNKIMSWFSKKAIFMPNFHVKSESVKVQDYFKDQKNFLYKGKLDFLMFKDGIKHVC